jgi:hypothetical protein
MGTNSPGPRSQELNPPIFPPIERLHIATDRRLSLMRNPDALRTD